MDAKRLGAKAKFSPDDAEETLALAQIKQTNVTLVMLQQDRSFVRWWVLQEANQAIGLTQRFVFSFAELQPPPPTSLKRFYMHTGVNPLPALAPSRLAALGPIRAHPVGRFSGAMAPRPLPRGALQPGAASVPRGAEAQGEQHGRQRP